MDPSTAIQPGNPKVDDEKARYSKRLRLKQLNSTPLLGSWRLIQLLLTILSLSLENAKLDSSLKRHTALIKRIRQSMALDNRDQIMKDVDSLSLEKYIDELAGAIIEGLGRCKTEKDIWGAVEVENLLSHSVIIYQSFADHLCFTPALPKYFYPCLGVQSRQCNQPPTAGSSSKLNARTEGKRGFYTCREAASCSSVVLRISAGRYY
jgi:hypothetical protein